MTVDSLSKFARNLDDEFWTEVEEHLTGAERKIAEALRQAIANAQDSVDATEIARLIQIGDYDRAVSTMLGATDSGDPTMFIALRNAVDQAALHFMSEIAVGAIKVPMPRVTVQVDTLAEPTIQAIRQKSMKLVTEVTSATKAGLRTVLQDGMTQGNGPREIARDMRNMLGLTDRDAQAVLNYRAELERGSKAALQRQLRNRRHDGFVRRGELDQERIDRMVDDYEKRLLKHRAETIARTEAARAFSLGQQTLWAQIMDQQGIDEAHVLRYWTVAPGERTCDWCRDVADMNKDGVGMDEPFDTPDGPMDLPPGHPNCRCTIRVKFDLEAQVRSMAQSRK